MNRSTVIPALIGIGAALLLLLLIGGGIFAVVAVQSAISNAGSSSVRDEESDDAKDGDGPEAGSSSDSNESRDADIDGLVIGSGDVTVAGYFDFACPACGTFVDTNADQIADWLAEDSITLELHPVSILDRNSTTDYSTRAAAAFACQAEINPDDALEYFVALFGAQPSEQGEGISDKELIAGADDLGGASIEDCVNDGDRLDWVTAQTEQAMTEGLVGTPWVLVDGEQYDGAGDAAAEFADFVGV